MKTESKFFLIIFFTIILSLSIINIISIYNIKEHYTESLLHDVENYTLLKDNNIKFDLPDYMKILKRFYEMDEYSLFFMNDKYYFYLKKDYFRNKINNYLKLLLMWDCIIIIVILSLYYLAIRKILLKEHQLDKTNEITLFTLKHKLNNYLAGQRLNIEILQDSLSNRPKSLERMMESNKKLLRDLENTFDFITEFKKNNNKFVTIDLEKIISKSIDDFLFQYKRELKVSLQPFKKTAYKNDVEFLIYLILDNVFKYSEKFIQIKGIKRKFGYILIIRNDIKESVNEGLGVGLQICEYLAIKNNIQLKTKLKNRYVTILIFKPFSFKINPT
jgi:hypothetical protein